ncbi:MAG TPA: adenosylcobinamide-GDP ribazoletransferase [Coriobacteriia bacterium]|nr:adenosylcobinamide-GDP ribazoletransferase [Coriobacteriia bacterium]
MKGSGASRPLRDAGLAFTLLTVAPFKIVWPSEGRPDVAGYFPLAGLALGTCASAVVALVTTVMAVSEHGGAALLVASATVAGLGLLTRFLHWDALADVADACGGGSSPEGRLEILDDPRVGAFGVSALVCVALLQVASLSVLVETGALVAVAVAPALSRSAAVFGAWFGRAARAEGLAASIAGPPRVLSALAAACAIIAVVTVAWATDPALGACALAGLLAALAIPHLLASRFGGVTGDVLGASVMLTETLVLVSFAITR